MEEGAEVPLRITTIKASSPPSLPSEHSAELRSFKSDLKWLFLDQSSVYSAALSWSLFFIFAIAVPLVSHLVYACYGCDTVHQRPFDGIVQLSLSGFATLSFISLSAAARKYGLRRFLFLDKLCDQSEKVQEGYTNQIHASVKILSAFVLPIFVADCAYKIWWFASGGTQIPYFYNHYLSNAIICILLLCSWLYRTAISLFVCVLFRLICYLQILRLEDYSRVFEKEANVSAILIEHLRIRRTLRVISHRFRFFILTTLILVTISQFMSLLVTMESSTNTNISTAGELALCSITLVTGLFICLRSAAKITHRAHALCSLAAKWHACATLSSFEFDNETPLSRTETPPMISQASLANWDSDKEEGYEDDELDDTNMMAVNAHTVSYQKRQALVTYFEHNKAGITVYGFMLDRSWLHTIFVIQLSLTLWILNKTIGIS
ncbi:PREDICTED: uncharacterized protein LOC109169764 isoform X2 [Ipomoea nil]|uniref:uncharacterized protein LOC109169764 isoform X2 n=1 Tax=Ipomoea nil TaxID=35883 RepID=UPI000900BF88|nr:PREDICTED: uncharacterized protein LOC109169764 isoform X2 [Ipomoea nil]